MTTFLSGLAVITLTTGALIALLLLLAPAAAKRFTPRWRYWVWLALALRLAVPLHFSLPDPLVTLTVPLPAATAAPQSADMLEELQVPEEIPVQPLPVGVENGVYAGNVHTPILDSAQVTVVKDGQVETDWTRQSIQWPNLLFMLWGLGAIALLGAELHRHWAFLRLCRRWRRPVEPELQAEADRRAAVMGLPHVPLYRCAAISTPMLAGLVHPSILLPLEGEGGHLSMALDHELTHFKRHDLWYNALLLWARALHWFNPLVWLMCRRAESDLEQCCDYDLLQGRSLADRKAYGAALLDQMAAGGSGTRLTTGFSGGKREVMARFKALLDTSAKKKGGLALLVVVLAALVVGFVVGCQEASEQDSTDPGYSDGVYRYRDETFDFEVPIPESLWEQLEVVQGSTDEVQYLSLVSRRLKERLEDFDAAEDYWLQVRSWEDGTGETLRSVFYGAWNYRYEFPFINTDSGELDELITLYAAAADVYRSFAFHNSGSGSAEQRTGSFYDREQGTYSNYDLKFQLDIPAEVYDRLEIYIPQSDPMVTLNVPNYGPCEQYHVYFVDRTLAGGVDLDKAIVDHDPLESYMQETCPGALFLHIELWKCTTGSHEPVLAYDMVPDESIGLEDELRSCAQAAGDSLRRLDGSSINVRRSKPDAYDRESGVYTNYKLGFRLSVPGEIYDRLFFYTEDVEQSGTDAENGKAAYRTVVSILDRSMVDEFRQPEETPVTDQNVLLTIWEAPDEKALKVQGPETWKGENQQLYAFARQAASQVSALDSAYFPNVITVTRAAEEPLDGFQPGQESDAYDREQEVYYNYDLDFKLNIPAEVYDQMEVMTSQETMGTWTDVSNEEPIFIQNVYFVNPLLAKDFDPDGALIGIDNFFDIVYLNVYQLKFPSGASETILSGYSCANYEDNVGREDGPYPYLEDIIKTLRRLDDSAPNGEYQALKTDDYDRETGIYTNYNLGFQLEIPPEVFDRLEVKTKAVERAMIGLQAQTGETSIVQMVCFVDRDATEDLDLLIKNREVFLLVEKWDDEMNIIVGAARAEERLELFQSAADIADTFKPLDFAGVNSTFTDRRSAQLNDSASVCEDGSYQATTGWVQYFPETRTLRFSPLNDTRTTGEVVYAMPLAEDVVLTPFRDAPEGVEVTPDYVINSMAQPGWSSYLPILTITIESGEITELTAK